MEPLATVDDLAVFTGREIDGGQAAAMLDQASAMVRSFCGWDIFPVQTNVAVTVDGSGASVQPLPTARLLAVSAVVEDGTDVDLAYVAWSQAGYLTRPGWGCRWTCAERGITATITHGYDTVPADVQAVVLGVVARATANPSGLLREQVGPFAVTYSQPTAGFPASGGLAVMPHEERVLQRYAVPLA